MENTRNFISLRLLCIAGLVLCLAIGCAQPLRQSHGEAKVDRPTALLTGPAVGHWAEQDEHAVIVYTVLGTDCTQLSAQAAEPVFASHGFFALATGETLCALHLRNNQRVLWHAEAP